MNIKTYDAIVIGSGAAGLNAADVLYENGMTNIAIITEGLYTSTSINTGSDKQTYYKLSTTGGVPDSVLDMAKTYYNCGGMQGYHALKESALSLRCFFKLVEALKNAYVSTSISITSYPLSFQAHFSCDSYFAILFRQIYSYFSHTQ